jgi:hypothetical protein
MSDEETQKILTDAEHVSGMLQSQGWMLVKSKLDGRILDLQNINNLDLEKPDTLSMQLMARKMAVDEIWAWLKADVYGFVEQAATNAARKPQKEDEIIDRGEGGTT